MRFWAGILCIGLLLTLVPCVANAAVTITVRPEANIRGPVLLLGDIAAVGGDEPERVRLLKELRLGEAPAPGTTMFLTPVTLEPKLAATRADFSAVTWSVPDNIRITTQSQTVDGRKIAALARDYLAQSAMGATVTVAETPLDILAPAGKLELTPELSGSVRYSGPTTVAVTVRTEGQSFARVPVQLTVRRYLDVVVAASNLNGGDLLSVQSLRLERMDAGKLASGYLTDLDKAVGMRTRYAMAPGSVIYDKMISRPILVQQGETVSLRARVGDLEVSAAGVALSKGAAGDLVRVRNTATKKILTGRVQEDKTVLVLNQQEG